MITEFLAKIVQGDQNTSYFFHCIRNGKRDRKDFVL